MRLVDKTTKICPFSCYVLFFEDTPKKLEKCPKREQHALVKLVADNGNRVLGNFNLIYLFFCLSFQAMGNLGITFIS